MANAFDEARRTIGKALGEGGASRKRLSPKKSAEREAKIIRRRILQLDIDEARAKAHATRDPREPPRS